MTNANSRGHRQVLCLTTLLLTGTFTGCYAPLLAPATPATHLPDSFRTPVRSQLMMKRNFATLSRRPPRYEIAAGDVLDITIPGLAEDGFVIAPHTRTHPLLCRISIEEAREEVVGSLSDVREQIGGSPRVLAYPAGNFDNAVAQMLEEEGFEIGFTVRRGSNDLERCDPFRLRRINIGRGKSLGLLRAQMLA